MSEWLSETKVFFLTEEMNGFYLLASFVVKGERKKIKEHIIQKS